MTIIRAFFLQIRVIFSNFQKRAGETSPPLPPPLVTRLVLLEAVAQRCSVKKVFLEISQNSQENTCARFFFLISCRPEACNFTKKETLARVNFAKFLRTPFLIEHLWWLLLSYFYLRRLLFDSILHYI